MKKLSTAFLLTTLLASVTSFAQTGRIYNIIQQQTQPFQQNDAVSKLDIETPFRCQTQGDLNNSISLTIPINKKTFTLKKETKSAPLPRFEVNGYDFENKPLDEAIQHLVDEAGILVYTQDNTYPSLSAKGIYGDLETVVNALTNNAETYYSYNASTQKLYISRTAEFSVQLPQNRLVLLGVLDALRGAGIENIVPDWKNGVLRLTLNKEEETKTRKILNEIKENGQLLVAKTQTYRLNNTVNWNQIMTSFGLNNIHSSNSSVYGRLLVLGQSSDTLLHILKAQAGAHLISNGISVVPNKWKTVFDITKCATPNTFSTPLHLSLNPVLSKNSTISAEIGLYTPRGELSSFDVTATLNDDFAIIGLSEPTGSSLLILTKLNLIRLVGESE